MKDRLPKGEHVYVIQNMDGLYKIGRSASLGQRMTALRASEGMGIRIVHLIKTSRSSKIERLLHKRFSTVRARGEWFSLASQDVAWLLGYQEPIVSQLALQLPVNHKVWATYDEITSPQPGDEDVWRARGMAAGYRTT